MFLGEFKQSINALSSVSDKLCATFAKLDIVSIKDLLTHFPRSYEDRQTPKHFGETQEGEYANTVVSVVSHEFRGHGKQILIVHVADEHATCELVCFNRSFLAKQLDIGKQYYFWGKINFFGDQMQSSQFVFERYSETPENFGQLFPVYATVKGLGQKRLYALIKQSMEKYGRFVQDELPPAIQTQYHFQAYKEALEQIHFPTNWKSYYRARKQLIYQELFHLQYVILRKKILDRQELKPVRKLAKTQLDALLGSVPFEMTADQKTTLDAILSDIASPYNLNRMVQGDVGSGKTLVAFASSLPVIEGGGQVVLMVPTELLARQHFKNANKLLTPLGISIDLLVGGMKAPERRNALERIASGQSHFIVGTHALFSQDVNYHRLELTIIDEQHRFGVEQRRLLLEKSHYQDLLTMTATPIPRSLAMTAYGDLDVSQIRTMPAGRIPIETYLALQGKEDKVYGFVKRELLKGHQAYFVFPLVETSEKLILRDASSMYTLLNEKIYPEFKVGLVHAKLADDEKQLVMNDFAQGKYDILVATTVVEVGVDVSNANVIVIDNAEQFGLSALHQLRGRVGRGSVASYAFLLCRPDLSEEGQVRLRTMRDNLDGFVVAEKDLEMRGPGDVSGVQQSGFLRLKIANLVRDEKILTQARADVQTLLEENSQAENKILSDLFEIAPPFNEDLITLN